MPKTSKDKDEVAINFDSFMHDWHQQLSAIISSSAFGKSKLEACYRRIAVLNSWRLDVLAPILDERVLQFFLEFQNDALQSLVFASAGAWRPALQCLRSGIEDALHCIYYKDHPVEYVLWERGKFRMGFTALAKYLEEHPLIADNTSALGAVIKIKHEYSTLSRAVHGHKLFRMTVDGTDGTVLFSANSASLGAYHTRQRATISSLSTALAFLFHDQLQGTRHGQLRKAMKPLILVNAATELKQAFGVHI